MGLDAGGIFGVVFLCTFIPLSLVAVVFFFLRRTVQPIKARLPPLVVVSDLVLIAYMIVLCVQRIVGDDYPCWLNLWQAFLGTIILCNTYVVRCWLLFFNYFHTQQLLNTKDELLLADHKEWDQPTRSRARSKLDTNFFFRFKDYTDLRWLLKAVSLLTCVLMIPCIILTGVSEDVRNTKGDACDREWGDVVLAVYVSLYICCYMYFAVQLRQVVDGFRIKEELRFTGVVAILVVIPWFLFNNVWEDVNNDVFPFSTLALILACTAALSASTIWPLYRSLYRPPALVFSIPEDISNLQSLLANEDGFRSFREFLTREFSVENVLFWDEVRRYRAEKAIGTDRIDLLVFARNIYAKYIISGAPFEVNLPGDIVAEVKEALKEDYGRSNDEVMTKAAAEHEQEDSLQITLGPDGQEKVVSTIFDRAVENIFRLMETDSYQRYLSSDLYKELTERVAREKKRKEVLQQMDIL